MVIKGKAFEIMVNTMRQQGNIWGEYPKNRDTWITHEIRPFTKGTTEYAFFSGIIYLPIALQ